MTCLQYSKFIQQMEASLVNSSRGSDCLMAIILIQFEGITKLDTLLGFQSVDALLEDAAKRLRDTLPETVLIGVLDRHHLMCFLPKLPAPSYAELAGHQILRTLRQPLNYELRNYILTPHLGISITNDPHLGANELLRQANSALRSDRKLGAFITVYSSIFDKDQLLELELMTDLDKAIEENRLSLVYQPQISLNTNKIIGVEALLRWEHPVRGHILTDMMIKTAERNDLISKLTYWVLHTTMHHLKKIFDHDIDVRMSVNISALNLREYDLVDIISEAMAVWGIRPELLTIEITETALMRDLVLVLGTLNRLKEMGIRISLDDFGTGYSSLAVLGKLPINELKLDMSLIKEMLKNPDQELIIASIIGLSHSLNLEVIAEGVEDIETRERLRALDCDLIQGYLVSKPLPLLEFIAYYKQRD